MIQRRHLNQLSSSTPQGIACWVATAMFPDATCHHSEGWGPVSQLRPFDLTPCFEEAVLFTVPLGSLIVLSLIRVFQLRQFVALQRAQKINVRLLWGKLVRAHFNSGCLLPHPDRPTTT